MSMDIRDVSGRPIEIFQDLPVSGNNRLVQTSGMSGDFGKANFTQYRGEEYEVWFSSYRPRIDSILTASSDDAILELHISLQNQIEGEWEGIVSPSLRAYQCALSYTPFVKTRALFRGGVAYETCDLHFRKSFLQGLAPDFPLLSAFLKKVEKGIATDLSQQPVSCTIDMMRAIQTISRQPITERMHKHLLELRVKEILISFLEKAHEEATERVAIKLTVADIEGLHRAKDLIEEDIVEMPSMKDIVRLTLLNEFKLKKGFKMIFGMSMGQYHIQRKIEAAKNMLLTSDEPVAKISSSLGYVYDHNFSSEFKRQTGMSPREFRGLRRC